jgi:hypothetical protein
MSAGNCRITLVDESGMIRTQMGKENKSEMVECSGRLERCHPVRATVRSHDACVSVPTEAVCGMNDMPLETNHAFVHFNFASPK